MKSYQGIKMVFAAAFVGILLLSTGPVLGQEARDFTVLIVMPDGHSVPVTVSGSDTPDTIKVQIEDKEGIPPTQQHLIFGDKELQDGRTLAEQGVLRESRIELVVDAR